MSKSRVATKLREFYRYYHTPKKQALEDAKVRIPMRKKDGTLGKKFTVTYRCAICDKLSAKVHVDHHPIPVGKQPEFPYEIEELIAYIRRMLCSKDNLRVLCVPCHKAHTKDQRRK